MNKLNHVVIHPTNVNYNDLQPYNKQYICQKKNAQPKLGEETLREKDLQLCDYIMT